MRGDDICLYLSADARAALQALAADRNTPRKLVWRAGIVLATADGDSTFEIMFEIMRRARPSKPTVWRWQARYLEEGVSGLKRDKIRRDKTRLSRVPPLPRETRLKVIARTVQDSPPNATHWSRALMAASVGISPSSMGRIRAQAGLKPHLIRGFKVSNDPLLEEKVTDIVGLFLDPPEPAVVLCVDEKSRIQALAGEASPVQTALHAARRVMAEPRRTVLCRDHLKAHPPRQLHQRRRTGGHHLRLPDAAQHQAQAIHLEQDRLTRKRRAPSQSTE